MSFTSEHDVLQRELVQDDEVRRLLFAATTLVCSSERRCQSCEHHRTALEALHARIDAVWPRRRPSVDPEHPEAGGHEYLPPGPVADDLWGHDMKLET